MTNSSSSQAGWNNTDEAAPLVVRDGRAVTEERTNVPITNTDTLRRTESRSQPEGHIAVMAPSPRLMRLSALVGIGIVLAIVVWSFGIVNIKGSLSGDAVVVDVQITAAGHFDPATITVAPGSTLTIQSKTSGAQVLKSNDPEPLFPIQVLFADPFTTTIPQDASGIYTVYSQSLPATEVLTINVTDAPSAVSGSSPQIPIPFAAPSGDGGETPIPFGGSAQTPIPFGEPSPATTPIPFGGSSSPPASFSSSASSVQSSAPSSASSAQQTSVPQISVIPVGGGGIGGIEAVRGGSVFSIPRSGTQAPLPVFTTHAIPTNPFTVAQSEKSTTRAALLAQQLRNAEKAHKGAPLQQLKKHTPKQVAETGPEGVWLVVIIGMICVGCLYRRSSCEL